MQYANSVAARTTRPAEGIVTRLEKRPRARRRPAKSHTLRDYLELEWLPHVETQVKPSSFVSLESHVRLHIAPDIGDIPVERLTRDDLAAFYARLLHKPATNRGDRTLSRSSIQRIHATLHWALEHLVLGGRLPTNPAHGLRTRRRKWENHEFGIWTPNELRFFLSQVEGHPLYAMWRLLAWTGMRRGEVLALKWADLRAETKTITIRRALSLVRGRILISTPKSAQSRALVLDRETMRILRQHERGQRRQRQAADTSRTPSLDWMFPGKEGEPINPISISKTFKEIILALGLPEIRLHDLRHTHASHLILSGANIKAVQERLGHADIVLTLNTYSHLLPTTQVDAVAALARFYR